MMTKKQTLHWAIAAAVASLPLFALSQPAKAQFPANQDGHANDANNRVGSNGVNNDVRPGGGVSGNQIITGNVTAGKEFRGPVGYGDPRSFRAPVGGLNNEDFVKNSAGTPVPYTTPQDPYQARPFYGDARAVAPPAGSLPIGFTGGYVGTTLNTPLTMSFGQNSAPAAEGLQSRTLNRDTLEYNAQLNEFGYPGLATPASQLNPNLASPLWGVRQPGQNAQNDTTMGQNSPTAGDRFRSQNDTLQAYQRELQDAAGIRPPTQQPGNNGSQQNSNGTNQQNNGQQNNNGQSPQDTGSPLNRPLNNPLEAPGDATIRTQQPASTLNNGPLNSSINTQESYRNYLQVPPAAQQSPQVAELQKRLERYNADHPQTDADANRAFQADRRRASEIAARGNGVNATPTATVGAGPLARGGVGPAVGAGGSGRAADATPLVLHSLADGIKAKGLHDMMASAEDLMRQDKFESALERYGQAGRIAPNNPLVPLGRAVAELGAGYYAQADRDLRMVFRAAPELLRARLELNALMSKTRLEFVRKDLTGLTTTDAQSARPWFLLAFLAYNTGDDAQTGRNLDEAESRGGKMDRSIKQIRENWLGAEASKPATSQPAVVPTQTPVVRPTGGEINK